MAKLLCEKSYGLKAVNYFRKDAPSQMSELASKYASWIVRSSL